MTHDSFVADAPGDEITVTHVPVGASNLPWSKRQRISLGRAIVAAIHLFRARAGGYDWVLVPPVVLDHLYENPGWQRALKAIMRRLSGSRAGAALARLVCLSGLSSYAVIDIADRSAVSPFALGVIKPAIYFKRNLVSPSQSSGTRFEPLPMSIPSNLLRRGEEAPPTASRDVDLFVAGDFKTDERERLRVVGRLLAERGRRIDVLEERVPVDEYLTRMSRAKVVGAAAGWGFHTWRMYEAAALGCLPLVTEPPAGMWSWFEDGVNCAFIRDTPEEMAAATEALLDAPATLERIATAARNRVLELHAEDRVAARIATLLSDASR